LHGGEFESFFTTLIQPPSEDYLNELAFFLCVGEQAPFSSAADVDELSPHDRNFWVKKLSELYKKQSEEMEKAKAKSKGKR
jgi:hypothetical protein